MIKQPKSFFAKIRQKLFEWNLEAEIYGGVFSHLERKADRGYPFESDEGLRQALADERRQVQNALREIEEAGKAMPRAYGEAFRYIAYRDLNQRLARYQTIAPRRIFPKNCDPRFVATHA